MNRSYAIRVLGNVYALGAAVVNDDDEALRILGGDIDEGEHLHLLEAAVGVGAACVTRRVDGDLLLIPEFDQIPSRLVTAIGQTVRNLPVEAIRLRSGEDAVELAARTVGDTWLWAVDGDREKAIVLARHHCLQMFGYRAQSR